MASKKRNYSEDYVSFGFVSVVINGEEKTTMSYLQQNSRKT